MRGEWTDILPSNQDQRGIARLELTATCWTAASLAAQSTTVTTASYSTTAMTASSYSLSESSPSSSSSGSASSVSASSSDHTSSQSSSSPAPSSSSPSSSDSDSLILPPALNRRFPRLRALLRPAILHQAILLQTLQPRALHYQRCRLRHR